MARHGPKMLQMTQYNFPAEAVTKKGFRRSFAQKLATKRAQRCSKDVPSWPHDALRWPQGSQRTLEIGISKEARDSVSFRWGLARSERIHTKVAGSQSSGYAGISELPSGPIGPSWGRHKSPRAALGPSGKSSVPWGFAFTRRLLTQ